MSQEIEFDLDSSQVEAALAKLTNGELLRYTKPACKVTADNVAREAKLRLERQLGSFATGATASGIHVEESHDRDGYAVISDRNPFPNLPLWIERGTRKGKPRSHREPARPYFDISAKLELEPHRRRLVQAIQQAIAAVGLGS